MKLFLNVYKKQADGSSTTELETEMIPAPYEIEDGGTVSNSFKFERDGIEYWVTIED